MPYVTDTSNGIVLEAGGRTIRLDPKKVENGINFVSHAHIDHLPASGSGTVLTSEQTARLASLRGYGMSDATYDADGLEMHAAGHVLGSQGLLADDTFYTGDICTRDRGFLNGARVPKCRTLITECTFGLPEFAFPPFRQIRAHVDETIAMLYSRGIPVILMGYEFGKAQTISHMFAHWEPMYYHDSVKRMNDMHRALGVPLKPGPGHTEAMVLGLLDKKPWVMVAPMLGPKTPFGQEMKRYGAVTIAFSGWAGSRRFPYSRGADYFVPLSDHCDFGELVRMVEDTGAQEVYTIHGFVNEFAAHLRERGISARPLASGAAAD